MRGRSGAALGSEQPSHSTLAVDGLGPVCVAAMPLPFNGWLFVTAVRRSAFTADINQNIRRLMIVAIGLLALAALTAAPFTNLGFVRLIRRIAGELCQVEAFALGKVARQPTWLVELDDFSAALKRMAADDLLVRKIGTSMIRARLAQIAIFQLVEQTNGRAG
jgi:adenylate cyclase